MSTATATDLPRRERSERMTWECLADSLAWDLVENDARRTYLYANPEKAELAVMTGARMNERTAHCFACGEGQTVHGSSLEAFDWMAEHNAEQHPRRFRAMQARGGR